MKVVARKFIGNCDDKFTFQRGNETFVRNWRPVSHTKPMTPSELAAEIKALEG